MNINKKKPNYVLLFILILCFAVIHLHADSKELTSALNNRLLNYNSFGLSNGDSQLFLLNFGLGGVTIRERPYHHMGTIGMILGLSYINGQHFYGARVASAVIIGGSCYDLSVLYGRAWISKKSLFSIASGIGYSGFGGEGGPVMHIGVPIDIKIFGLSSKGAGLSFGINAFAFITSSFQHFGICLSLGIFGSGPLIPINTPYPK